MLNHKSSLFFNAQMKLTLLKDTILNIKGEESGKNVEDEILKYLRGVVKGSFMGFYCIAKSPFAYLPIHRAERR